jgi:phosphatidylethanolamine/phosphatidyl-N-methylethanolamine N-methyltransferase
LSLKHSYTLISPFYDAALTAATRAQRARSLAALPQTPARVLLERRRHRPRSAAPAEAARYTGIDLTHAMLRRALPRAAGLDFSLRSG